MICGLPSTGKYPPKHDGPLGYGRNVR